MGTSVERKDVNYSPVKGQENVKLPLIGARHWQVLLLFILVCVAFGFRVILSVAIIAMTDPTASTNPDVPTYDWKDKGTILSSFFWGYLWTQAFAGYAAKRFGAKWFLIGAISVQSMLSLLTPLTAAFFGSYGMCVSRAVQGTCQGFVFPSVTHQLTQWVPPNERSRLSSVIFGSAPLGTVVAMLVTGVISAGWYGWPMVFYLYGAVGLGWCVLFALLGADSPASHSSISKEEKYYIEESLGHTGEKACVGGFQTNKVPWKKIFTSVPLWAVFLAQTGNNYAFWTLLTQIPSYMNHVMHFDIKNNSLLSSLPYFTGWAVSFPYGYISDTIINKKWVSVSTSRKIFNSFGMLVPALALIVLGYTREDQTTQAVILLVVAVASNGATLAGWALNHMDLAPNYAGTLMGLTNGASHVSAISAPLIVQMVVTDEGDPHQWKLIFWLTAGILTAVAVVFNIFGTAEKQDWNEGASEENEKC